MRINRRLRFGYGENAKGGAVGKTSIVNRLVHKTFKDEKKTEGIKITGWPLAVGEKKDKVRLNVWDFGG